MNHRLLPRRLGPRYLVGLALVLWSMAQAAGGLADSYTQWMWGRIALSATESPAFPGAIRVTSDWFHVQDRGKPTGVYNSGGSIGPAIAPPRPFSGQASPTRSRPPRMGKHCQVGGPRRGAAACPA